MAAGLLAIGAVVALTRHLAGAEALGPWPERLGTLVALLLGGLLLRLVTRDPGD